MFVLRLPGLSFFRLSAIGMYLRMLSDLAMCPKYCSFLLRLSGTNLCRGYVTVCSNVAVLVPCSVPLIVVVIITAVISHGPYAYNYCGFGSYQSFCQLRGLYDRSGDGKHCRKTAWGCIVLAYSVIAWGILCSRREGNGVAVQATAMRRLL